MKQYIEFKKKRELGEIFSDTFAFIRNEYKPFFKTIINVAGPYLALFLFGLVFYMYVVDNSFSFNFQDPDAFPTENFAMIFAAYAAYLVTAILAYTFTVSTALHYIKSYVDNNGTTKLQEIKASVHQSFWGFLGLSILKGLTLGVAIMLCCLPILYFMIPMAVVFPIYVFAKKNATDAYGESYSLVRNELVMTGVTVFLIWLVLIVIAYCFMIPIMMYSYMKMGVFSGEFDPANMDSFVDPVYIALNVLSSFFQFLLNLVFIVASVFIYFSLNEKKNFTGTFERIDSLGKTEE
ncbi:hypothetical protein [Lacinutrix sp. MedPE-SW]|uniref:hypothetical protein n=1 Tax=Lacinutrix sp. MedPE-SW TaxID=1860087 RepID=UPI0009153DE3|nr:hypothetical protein [Lacinutrix sp. MedPE-SW]OIQ22990.1 MAG: hypothetical protein BM549_05570 [Lacinutrix sp. MedPE-SW]